MVEAEIRRALIKFSRAVEEKGVRVQKVILYGSRARERWHEFSDIDVAIVSPDFGRDRFEEGVKLFQIASEIDPRIEPVPVSLKAYQQDTWVPLIHEIREKGTEVKM